MSKKAFRGKFFGDKIVPKAHELTQMKKVTTCKNYVKMKTILHLVARIGVNFHLTYLSWVLIRATYFHIVKLL